MSLNNAIDWFDQIWEEFRQDDTRSTDGVPYAINKEIEKTPLLVNHVIDEFIREEDLELKEVLASLIVYHTPYTPAIEWLRDNSDWTKEDFAEFGINIDDY
ncbi:MAG: hypothetical protein H6624_09510 [Bdellovibrionaceae bacterium]|nr:hypothetical protein [Bdellovibrionales bacterium]MCB9084572.1 hypothetical protein [Pseudobdellovibrionaceae bacterium]